MIPRYVAVTTVDRTTEPQRGQRGGGETERRRPLRRLTPEGYPVDQSPGRSRWLISFTPLALIAAFTLSLVNACVTPARSAATFSYHLRAIPRISSVSAPGCSTMR